MNTIINYLKNTAAFLLMCGVAFWALLSRQEEREKRKRLDDLIKGKNAQIARQLEIKRQNQEKRDQVSREIAAGKRDFFEE